MERLFRYIIFVVFFSSSCKSKPHPHNNWSTCSSIVNIEIEEQSLLRRRPLSSFAIERFLFFRLCSFSQVKAVRCGNCRTSVNIGTTELIPRSIVAQNLFEQRFP